MKKQDERQAFDRRLVRQQVNCSRFLNDSGISATGAAYVLVESQGSHRHKCRSSLLSSCGWRHSNPQVSREFRRVGAPRPRRPGFDSPGIVALAKVGLRFCCPCLGRLQNCSNGARPKPPSRCESGCGARLRANPRRRARARRLSPETTRGRGGRYRHPRRRRGRVGPRPSRRAVQHWSSFANSNVLVWIVAWSYRSNITWKGCYSARAIVPDGVHRRKSAPMSTSITRPQAAGSSPQKRVAWAGVNVKPGISRNSARTRWTRASKFEWRFNLSGLMKPPKACPDSSKMRAAAAE